MVYGHCRDFVSSNIGANALTYLQQKLHNLVILRRRWNMFVSRFYIFVARLKNDYVCVYLDVY